MYDEEVVKHHGRWCMKKLKLCCLVMENMTQKLLLAQTSVQAGYIETLSVLCSITVKEIVSDHGCCSPVLQ